jgi:hypothetical protein
MFFESQKCIFCHSEDVVRNPPLSHNNVVKTTTAPTGNSKPGKIVDKYISDAKEEIRKEKIKLRSEEK